jgi:hypothetical protein
LPIQPANRPRGARRVHQADVSRDPSQRAGRRPDAAQGQAIGGRAATLDYIADMTRSLSGLARQCGEPTLAYLLDMALAEASQALAGAGGQAGDSSA